MSHRRTQRRKLEREQSTERDNEDMILDLRWKTRKTGLGTPPDPRYESSDAPIRSKVDQSIKYFNDEEECNEWLWRTYMTARYPYYKKETCHLESFEQAFGTTGAYFVYQDVSVE